MPKPLRIAGYFLLFIISFFVFLYWTFPYETLKDRLINAAAQQLGNEYDVKIGDFSPSLFTGASIRNIKILKHENGITSTVWEASKVKIRASLGSILFGKTDISFYIRNKKSEVEGSFKVTEDGFSFDGDFSKFDIGDFGLFTEEGSARLVSAINGTLKININNKQVLQSAGVADLELSDMVMKAGELKLGEGASFAIPEIVLSKGSGSSMKLELSRGAIRVKELRLQDGDLRLDLTGDIFMSTSAKNYRMNLRGTFSASQKLEQAIPVLFMVEKQKQPDGSYPLTITGRLGQPTIKVGDFTLPF